MEPERLRETYKECMHNHAAKLGTYASDGCCEFIPGEDPPLGSLHCAACGCHRNFHRKEMSFAGAGRKIISAAPLGINGCSPEARRRHRTKFSAEQKVRLSSFAEQIGWRIPKREGDGDEDQVARFCREIGVSRQVFKVWLHNHKGGPVPAQQVSSAAESIGGTVTASPAMNLASDAFMGMEK